MNLCDELQPFIERDLETCVRTPIEVERQVAVILYYLSDEGHMRKTANAFERSRSSVSLILHRVMCAISLQLGPKYIKVPMTDKTVQEKVESIYRAFSIPQCLGAIDGTHIEIQQPSANSTDYINHKTLSMYRHFVIIYMYIALWTSL